MRTLKDKTAVITGAGSGIGRALALALAAEGSRLALADKNPAGLKETARLLKGAQSKAWVLDVSRRGPVEAFARKVRSSLGPADIVVNNAGVNSFGLVADTSYKTLEWILNVNLWGVLNMTKAFLPQLLSRPESSLVNLSSSLGLVGFYGQAVYSASKFAVRGFSESLQQELKGGPLAVTLVYPGGVRTGIHRASRNEYRLTGPQKDQARREMESSLRSTAPQAANEIVRGIRRGSKRVLIGLDARLIDRLARWFPGQVGLYLDLAKGKDPFWRKMKSPDKKKGG